MANMVTTIIYERYVINKLSSAIYKYPSPIAQQ